MKYLSKLGFGLAMALGLMACSGSATQLVVVVESDLSAPDDLSQVNALVQSQEFQPVWSNEFQISAASDLPFSFGVEAGSGEANEVTIDLYAINAAGKTTVTRRAVVSLIENKSLVLNLSLSENCQNVTCQQQQTCVSGGCDSWQVDASTLSENLEPGDEL